MSLHAEKRLNEILSRLEQLGEVDEITEEQETEIENLEKESIKLTATIEAQKKVNNLKNSISKSPGRQIPPEPTRAAVEGKTQRLEVFEKPHPLYGFKSRGEFFSAVKDAGFGRIHPNFQNNYFESSGQDGGFLVPPEISTEINDKIVSEESLWGKAEKISISRNTFSAVFDETQPWYSGAVSSGWLGEGAAIPESSQKLKRVDWKLKKLGTLVRATDEVLSDATAIESWIRTTVPRKMMHVLNDAFINGDGVLEPEGILNSGFMKTIAKESSQAAKTVNTANVIKMFNAMLPMARRGAIWLCQQEVESQLMRLQDPEGHYLWLAPGSQMNNSPYGRLFNLPVMPMLSSMRELGKKGDIILANPGWYYCIEQMAGIRSDVSIHVNFKSDESVFRFLLRTDGRTPWSKPVKAQYGSFTTSAFVTLAERA